MKTRNLFDVYAHEYDLITDAGAREPYHRREVQSLVHRFQPSSVLDAGCANGLTTRLFAEQGVKSVGLDRSRKMLAEARKRYGRTKLPMTFKSGCFEKLPKNITRQFDLVVCLANSISGVGSLTNLGLSLEGFRRVLRPGGVLVLQLLNYELLKEGELRTIKTTENKGIVYARYQRRRGRDIEVHIVRIDLRTKPISMEPFCHSFGNFTSKQIMIKARQAGMVRLKMFSDLFLRKRSLKTSRDLVLVAFRPVE